MNRRGISVVELLVSVTLFSFLITFAFPGMKALFNQLELTRNIRTVTAALQHARYQAILRNQPVKVECQGLQLLLKIKQQTGWQPLQQFLLSDNAHLSMNASPVFFPSGYASPLCTVQLQVNNHRVRITLSIMGRIKVYSVP